MAKKFSEMAALAALKEGSLKNVRSSIGFGMRNSHQPNANNTTTATANAPKVAPSLHPWIGPSMIPYSNAPRPTIESPAPTRSKVADSGSRDVGTKKRPPIRARITTGTLR
jgi:hypothetical protein